MKAPELSRKYATAIFGLVLEDWLTALKTVQDKLVGQSALLKTIELEQSFQNKQILLDKLIPPDSPVRVRNFLYILLKENHLSLLGEVLSDLQRISRSGPQVQVAYVTTAMALSIEEQEKFRQKLRAHYGDNLEFSFNVDTTIIGGAIVQIGDKRIDGSIATRLDAMGRAIGLG